IFGKVDSFRILLHWGEHGFRTGLVTTTITTRITKLFRSIQKEEIFRFQNKLDDGTGYYSEFKLSEDKE
ncbi:hypothetical protein X975_05275, partial [Stegodyphus mimosarum]